MNAFYLAPRPLRVLDLTEFYSPRGGVRCHLDMKSDALVRAGHEHWIVAPGPNEDRRVMEDREPATRVVRVGGPPLPYDANYHLMWRLDRVRSAVERARADVLEVNSPYLAMLLARWLRPHHAKIVTFYWHADFVDAYLAPRLVSGPRDRILGAVWRGIKKWLDACDAVFASSEAQADKLQAHGVARVVRLRAGIDRRRFHPAARSAEERARWVRGRPEALLLVGAGRLAGEKRWDVVIDAFRRFRKRHDAVLVLFGEGPERAALERRAAECGDVFLAGFERDPSRLATAFASADALVHGCAHETFGLSVAQAAACGTPLVVPDEGASAALVDPACGATYRALDPGAASTALERLFEAPRGELRRRAVESSSRVPDASEQFAQMVSVYRELIELRGRVSA